MSENQMSNHLCAIESQPRVSGMRHYYRKPHMTIDKMFLQTSDTIKLRKRDIETAKDAQVVIYPKWRSWGTTEDAPKRLADPRRQRVEDRQDGRRLVHRQFGRPAMIRSMTTREGKLCPTKREGRSRRESCEGYVLLRASELWTRLVCLM